MTDEIYINHLKNEIKQLLAAELETDLEDIDLSQDAIDYGLDSIMAANFITNLDKRFAIKIDPISIFEHDSLDEMIEVLFNENQQKIIDVYEKE